MHHRLRYARRGGVLGLDPTLRWLDRLSMHFDTAIDVGAHHGLFARALAQKSREVIAIEPRPAAVEHMAAVLPANCRPMCLALSDRAGPLRLSTPLKRGRPDYALTFAERGAPTQGATYDWTTQATTLDALVSDRLAGQKIGFIKLDVEGHELAVLRGAAATIATHRPIILAEAERRHGCDVTALFQTMSRAGYVAALPWCGITHGVTGDEFLSLQAASNPDRPDYVNNVLFVPGEPGPAG